MKGKILIFILFTFLSNSVAIAQNDNLKTVKVKGLVTNAQGVPIKKGDVFVDSLKTGVRTNKRGEYKLRVPVKSNFISIYSEEYGIQTMVYNGEGIVNFAFPEKGEVKTKNELSKLGYIFDVEAFRNMGKKSFSEYTDIFQIIREKFSGVRIEGNTIYVRGIISLDGNQTPLFVVDGNYVNSIANINPDELKSIDLLKGEEASIYGARGAAGVFVISLK
ncbi:hypothetical protein FEE95_15660 [Maribacter algarum]|uniref:TonB-dependent receptor plug domain-containing protein n=1 Tax=Maribacter algarum (ex Zhang et al. 2020) TaxID=2578118 RepID=A0A5S3PNJ9_9FLAO|nr:TonB-dependent receptor plug domain-containing protein [Maribacter algarum]TMM56069.1 hypothetical protein FEE95_15660 [Maribacter algarum]